MLRYIDVVMNNSNNKNKNMFWILIANETDSLIRIM